MEALERDLVAAAREGDREAFRVLAERYYGKVYRMLLAMTRDPEAALDLTQETFAKALRGVAEFEMTASFYTWLYRIARNAYVDRARRSWARESETLPDDRTPPPQGEQPFPVGPRAPQDPAAEVEVQETLRAVRAALDLIRPTHREILLLREVEGLSYNEIAAVLGVRPGTVMSRLFAARMALREVLKTRFGWQAEVRGG